MGRTPSILCPKLALPARAREPLIDVELAVVTPLFGGGPTAREADSVTPVRGASVRGHLRFWWRACRAAAHGDVGSLHHEEAGFWGATPDRADERLGPARIEIAIKVVDPGKPTACRVPDPTKQRSLMWKPDWPPYALFPFQEDTTRPDPAWALVGVRFRLGLYGPPGLSDGDADALRTEAERAVWAWVTFGGIGARTRRGCGALVYVESRLDSGSAARFRPTGDVLAWVRERASALVAPGAGNPLLPKLTGARLLLRPDRPVEEGLSAYEARQAGPRVRDTEPAHRLPTIDAWNEAVKALWAYRQGPGVGRERGSGTVPGPSRWPEADALRLDKELGLPPPKHEPRRQPPSFFPRTNLGLPLLFQEMGGGETPTFEAAGADRGARRMASPVVVKPLATSEEDAVPCVLLLNAPDVWSEGTPGVALNGQSIPASELDIANYRLREKVPPLGNAHRSARDGFMAYVRWLWQQGEATLPDAPA